MTTTDPPDAGKIVSKLVAGQLDYPWEALPGEMKRFAHSTAQRCSVPDCVPATACLALAARLAGNHARLEYGMGVPVGANSYFLMGVDPTAHYALAIGSVLAPALRLQERLLGDSGGKENGQRLPPYSDHMVRLMQGDRSKEPVKRRSLLLSSDLPEENWDKLLEASQGTLLHYSLNGESLQDILDHTEKRKRYPGTKTLKRAYAEEARIMDSGGNVDAVWFQRQTLNLLWTGSPDQVKRFVAARGVLESGLSPCFVAFDSQSKASELNAAVLEPRAGVIEWERKLEELWNVSSAAEDQIWQVSPETKAVVYRFIIFVERRLLRLAPHSRPILAAWTERVWKVALLLHLFDHWNVEVIPSTTAWRAVYLSAWYIGRQFELLP